MGEEALFSRYLSKYLEKNSVRYGLISLNHILFHADIKFLQAFLKRNSIHSDSYDDLTRDRAVQLILKFYYDLFEHDKELQQTYRDPISLLGEFLYQEIQSTIYAYDYDFISKMDLIDIFADYCADLGINTYDARRVESYDFDLYLIKKTQGVFVTTETVFVRTAHELKNESYEDLLAKIARATLVAEWKLFVTTPAAVMQLGLERLIADMKRLNTWLYVVDPIQKRIFGIEKGKKNKARDPELRDHLIQQLPQTPLRAPSQVVNISKYNFEEKYAYKPKNHRKFILNPLDSPKSLQDRHDQANIFKDLLQTLLIMDSKSGLSVYSYQTEKSKFNEQMIAGFLSALESFVEGFGGKKGSEEISYKGFIVHAESGEKVKVIAILSHQSNLSFNERLKFFTSEFEAHYYEDIDLFLASGENSLSDNPSVAQLLHKIMAV